MRKLLFSLSVMMLWGGVAQGAVSLDSCRNMAIRNNKEIQQSRARVEGAGYQRKEAKAAYLPSLDLEASYFYNQKNISLLAEDQLLPTKTFNPKTQSYEFNLLTNPQTGLPITTANGQPIPSTVAYLPKSAMTFNVHNVFAGALTLTQPIYMGGKIKAMNEITRYAEELARSMQDSKVEDVVYDVDAAYWQVVSLKAKQKLAENYVKLLETFDNDVKKMLSEGVATKSNLLNVDVKLNEANVDLTKVKNGVALSRMLLAQLCGAPINSEFVLEDEDKDTWAVAEGSETYDLNDVYARRHEVRSLELAAKIYDEKAKVARASMLPQVAAVGMYSLMNPNSYNGYETKFAGAFSVGAMVKIPLWHWGGLTNKYKAAKTEATIKRLELADAKDKIELQVNQASFKNQEAWKTYEMTKKNLEKANENLRMAQVGFKEGVSTTSDVLAAQTAWLKANSEKIDAEIDVQLCNVYLSKVLGTMKY
ncbi:MAG: TolC family protein [Sodaliphilus sp.]|nr:TolC family protein [Sodaliphilus sp.]